MTGPEIKRLRNKIKLSMLEFCALTGLPESYLEMIEEEKVRPLESDVKRIKRALEEYRREEE